MLKAAMKAALEHLFIFYFQQVKYETTRPSF